MHFLDGREWLQSAVSAKEAGALRRFVRDLRPVFEASNAGDEPGVVDRLNALLARHPVTPYITGHDSPGRGPGRDGWHMHVADRQSSVAEVLIAESLLGLSTLVCELGATRLGVCGASPCRTAHLRSLDAGDCAEGTGVITSVGDLDVGRGSSLGAAEGGEHPLAAGDFRLLRLTQQAADYIADPMPLPGRQHVVDAAGDVVPVVAERRHAASGDDKLIVAPSVEQLGDGRDRLIARRAEEATGVDYHHPRVLRTFGGGHPTRAQEMIHPVGIDPVLGTAEGEYVKRAVARHES